MLFPDTALLVTALKDATSSHPDLAEGFAKLVSNATASAATAQRLGLREEVARVLGRECSNNRYISLQDILGLCL